MKHRQLLLTAVTVLATAGFVMTTAYAQTGGMERRGERRGNRDESRDAKAECKAGDEATRPECRQDKRDTRQEGRGDEEPKAPAEKPGDLNRSTQHRSEIVASASRMLAFLEAAR